MAVYSKLENLNYQFTYFKYLNGEMTKEELIEFKLELESKLDEVTKEIKYIEKYIEK